MEPPSPRALPLPDGFLPPGCTFSGQDWALLARRWFPVARADVVPAKPRQLTLLDLRLAIYRMPDGIRIGRDVCPHRGLPLSAGRIEGDELVCAFHGLRFGSDGQCRKVPEKLAPKTAECFSVTMFPAVERHGLIWTCLIPHGDPEIPEISSAAGDFDASDLASIIKLRSDFLMSIENFDFSIHGITIDPNHHLSLRDLALNEYQRLFESMGPAVATHA
ncbi:Rieske 2Fe-2S domain-containing protein [Variovorax sp. 770b2]|uniref:Rieske 2Fe-2S domain-containing protein n=1 Tax=Variovorax sp. 770b2 TaxID=1566271 RepID=UPI0008DFF664|nr:Rieske 2Fe-2S domain-containing protein [Variovorax sp. 770b2]SFP50929.1 Rieske [2Fe-2S] domain-containing protein [Variovorax sp. 770b2]